MLPAVLLGLGLSTLGPVGGGIFAWFQSIGWVGAGGVLATAQSIAMGGSVATAAVIAGTTTVVGTVAGAEIGRRIE